MNPFMTSLSLKTYLFDDDVPFYSLNQRLTDMDQNHTWLKLD